MLAPFLAEHDARPPAADAEQAPSFARLYEEHFSFVWRSARRLGAPEAIVDDVVFRKSSSSFTGGSPHSRGTHR